MGRSNLTVVANEGKNPTPWKEPAGLPPSGLSRAYDAAAQRASRHPAGSGLKDTTHTLLQKLQETRNDTHRRRLRAMHSQDISELDAEMQGMVAQHETETLLLDYRLAGNTLEGLGELAEDSVIEAAWTRLSEEFEL